MSWNRIDLESVAPTPWRNGGGVTRELAVWPSQGPWQWRMSVAEVASDGPFSRYDGVSRWFAVLSGAGLRLDVDGKSHSLHDGSEPLCFDGALDASCTLQGGATQDFNLMLRQDAARARMCRVKGARQLTLPNALTLAVYVVQGPASLKLDRQTLDLPAGTLVWQRLDADVSLRLAALHALWMEIE